MTRKVSFYAVGIFIIYTLFMYWYFFFFANTGLPFEFQQTAADPSTFLDSKELLLNEEYADWRNFLYFVVTPLEWLMYFLVMVTGLNKFFFRMGQESTRYVYLKVPIYLFWLTLVTTIFLLPVKYLSYHLSKLYQVSVQSFPSWMKDQLVDFWLYLLVILLVIPILYLIIKKFPKKWWFISWLGMIPIIILYMYVYPVVIDPLYNEFVPIENKQLEEKIITLATEANIPAAHVWQVNMSDKTNAMNAYVTGIGDNARIVLWDTTLDKLTEEEILYIMAHEIAHYIDKDIYQGIAGYIILALFVFYGIYRVYNYLIDNQNSLFKVEEKTDVKGFPIIILLLSIFLFATSPITNYVSRIQERQADAYAIELTQDADVAISAYQKLVKDNRSQVNPPLLVRIMKSTHPSSLERISKLEQFKIEQRNE